MWNDETTVWEWTPDVFFYVNRDCRTPALAVAPFFRTGKSYLGNCKGSHFVAFYERLLLIKANGAGCADENAPAKLSFFTIRWTCRKTHREFSVLAQLTFLFGKRERDVDDIGLRQSTAIASCFNCPGGRTRMSNLLANSILPLAKVQLWTILVTIFGHGLSMFLAGSP